MGFFSSSTPKPASEDLTPPDRSRRATCWAARDAFFACLDSHNISVSKTGKFGNEDDEKVCGKSLEGFRRDCKGSWVEYFIQKREVDRKKEELLKKMEKEKAQRVF